MKRGKKKASGERPTCYRNRGPPQMKMPGYLDVLAWALHVVLYTPSTHTHDRGRELSVVDRGLWVPGLHT